MFKIQNLIPKKIRKRISIYLRQTVYFYFKNGENEISAPKRDDKDFIVIEDYETYQKIIGVYIIEEITEHKQRLADGVKMVVLKDTNGMLCSGWLISNTPKFQINYNKTNLKIGKTAFNFFNFETPEHQRRNGYYQTLLVRTMNYFNGYDFLIYTAPSNIGSINGILGSGFKKLGTYRTIGNKMLFKKMKSLNIDIKKAK